MKIKLKFLILVYLLISILIILKTGSGIVSNVDVTFFFNPKLNFEKYQFLWFDLNNGYSLITDNMASSIYAILTYLLNSVVPLWVINKIWFILPFFLLGFAGYYFVSSLLKEHPQKEYISLLASIFLILNPYTSAQLSFGGVRVIFFLAMNIFFIGCFINFLKSSKKFDGFLVVILSGIASLYPPFFVISWILIFLYMLAFVTPKKIITQFKSLICVILGIVLINSWWLLPFLWVHIIESVSIYLGTRQFPLDSHISQLCKTMILKNHIPAEPVNHIQFSSFHNLISYLFVVTAFASFFIKKYRKLIIYSFINIVILLFLAKGLSEPFGEAYRFALMHIPFFNMFRDPNKFTAFLALFYSLLFSLTIIDTIKLIKLKINYNLLRKSLILIILSLVLITVCTISSPLLSGNLGGALKPFNLPNYYTMVENYLNNETKTDANILVLPIPCWFSEFTWHDDMNHIANPIRTIINPIIYDEFNDLNLNPLQKTLAHKLYNPNAPKEEILNLFKLLNIKYILVQNDQIRRPTGWSPNSNNIVLNNIHNNLNSNLKLTHTKTFGQLDIYEIPNNDTFPHIYSVQIPILILGSTDYIFGTIYDLDLCDKIIFTSNHINKKQQMFKENNFAIIATNKITFKKISPTKYIVSVENATQPFFLVFSESYHPQWKIYIEDKPTNFTQIIAEYPKLHVKEAKHDWYKFTPQDIKYLFKKSLPEKYHFLVNGYANAWYIDPKEIGSSNFTITLYFWPQSLFYLGLFISGLTFLGCVGYLGYDFWKEKRSGK